MPHPSPLAPRATSLSPAFPPSLLSHAPLGRGGSAMAEVVDLGEHLNPGRQEAPAPARFPLGREALIEAAQPVATVATVATCTALVLAQQGFDTTKHGPHAVAVMSGLLFAYLPFALFGLLTAAAVKTSPNLVGLSSGFMLADFLFPTIIGGIVNVAKHGEDAWIAGGVSVVIMILTVVSWSILCSYPKCLHNMARRGGNA